MALTTFTDGFPFSDGPSSSETFHFQSLGSPCQRYPVVFKTLIELLLGRVPRGTDGLAEILPQNHVQTQAHTLCHLHYVAELSV